MIYKRLFMRIAHGSCRVAGLCAALGSRVALDLGGRYHHGAAVRSLKSEKSYRVVE